MFLYESAVYNMVYVFILGRQMITLACYLHRCFGRFKYWCLLLQLAAQRIIIEGYSTIQAFKASV